ncbi:hypothetical protein Dimus_021904 [Dionaea muscipula]
MKGVKGKFAKKLESIKAIDYLKPAERILHVGAALDGFIDNFALKSNLLTPNFLIPKGQDPQKISQGSSLAALKGIDDEDSVPEQQTADKENARPWNSEDPFPSRSRSQEIDSDDCFSSWRQGEHLPLSETDASSFQPPDMDSDTLFDPNLLAAFEQAVAQIKARNLSRDRTIREEPPPQLVRSPKSGSVLADPLNGFQAETPARQYWPRRCSVHHQPSWDPKDLRGLSEHTVLAGELPDSFPREGHFHALGVQGRAVGDDGRKSVPPRLFIKGRYIGGAEEVLGLHERGKLMPLVEEVPLDRSNGPCQGCHGLRFVMCFNCRGSRKVFDEAEQQKRRCPACNENGLIVCPLCYAMLASC